MSASLSSVSGESGARESGEEFRLRLLAVVERLFAEKVSLEGRVELFLFEARAARGFENVEGFEAIPVVAEVFRERHVRRGVEEVRRVILT